MNTSIHLSIMPKTFLHYSKPAYQLPHVLRKKRDDQGPWARPVNAVLNRLPSAAI